MSLSKPIITLYNDTGINMVDMNDPATINVGISEFTMVTMACGLASEGYKVFTHAVTPHYLRAWEAVRTLLVPGNYDVTLIGSGEGNDYSSLGHTHQMDATEMRVYCRGAKIAYILINDKEDLMDWMKMDGPLFLQVPKRAIK